MTIGIVLRRFQLCVHYAVHRFYVIYFTYPALAVDVIYGVETQY